MANMQKKAGVDAYFDQFAAHIGTAKINNKSALEMLTDRLICNRKGGLEFGKAHEFADYVWKAKLHVSLAMYSLRLVQRTCEREGRGADRGSFLDARIVDIVLVQKIQRMCEDQDEFRRALHEVRCARHGYFFLLRWSFRSLEQLSNRMRFMFDMSENLRDTRNPEIAENLRYWLQGMHYSLDGFEPSVQLLRRVCLGDENKEQTA